MKKVHSFGKSAFLPVIGKSYDAAVILKATMMILHASMHHGTYGLINVVRTQVLQEIHHLIASRLKQKENVRLGLTIPMLRLRLSKAKGHKEFWKPL